MPMYRCPHCQSEQSGDLPPVKCAKCGRPGPLTKVSPAAAKEKPKAATPQMLKALPKPESKSTTISQSLPVPSKESSALRPPANTPTETVKSAETSFHSSSEIQSAPLVPPAPRQPALPDPGSSRQEVYLSEELPVPPKKPPVEPQPTPDKASHPQRTAKNGEIQVQEVETVSLMEMPTPPPGSKQAGAP